MTTCSGSASRLVDDDSVAPGVGRRLVLVRPYAGKVLPGSSLAAARALYPGKKFLTVVDFVDGTAGLQPIQTVASLVGLPPRSNCRGRDVLKVKDGLERAVLAAVVGQEAVDQEAQLAVLRRRPRSGGFGLEVLSEGGRGAAVAAGAWCRLTLGLTLAMVSIYSYFEEGAKTWLYVE